MSILVLNAGSSTLKFALFGDDAGEEIAGGGVDWQGGRSSAKLALRLPEVGEKQLEGEVEDYSGAVTWILESLAEALAGDPVKKVGHRVVHGGAEFRRTTLIDEQVKRALERISSLVPLHNPPALRTIEAAREALPGVAHVAVFDTAFFSGFPERAFVYPVPYEWYEQYGVRRFGFHGISHAYCSERAAEMLGRREHNRSLRLVICHLGNGCSATAVRGEVPLATTMGFTPLEGLMMGSRSGSIDPGILIYLLQTRGFDAKQLEDSLNRRSGLAGVSGVSSDFRRVEQAAGTGDERAGLAIGMFTDRIRSAIGSLAVSLGGVDALVFTAGIGENSPSVRRLVCEGLQCLGLHLDGDANKSCRPDCDIAARRSAGRILLIHTREEQWIARAVRGQHRR